jgi:trimeric autotransporter adhesin
MQTFRFLLIFIALTYSSIYAQNAGFKLNQGEMPVTTLDVNGATSLREGAALTLVNGVNNDINLSTSESSFYRLTGPTAAFSITGFTNGTNGRLLTVINATTQTMTVTGSTASIAANQILAGGASFNVPANGAASFQYNSTLSKWVLTATSGSATTPTNWSLTGNNGTTAGTHFLGTTDAQDMVLKAQNTEGVRLTTSGNLGVGTPTPTNKLSVNGHANINQHLAVGANSAVNNGALLFPTSTYQNIISAQEELTGNQTTTFSEGILSYLSINASNNPTTEFYAIDGIAEVKTGNTQNYAGVVGFYGGGFHKGSGTVTNLYGSASFAQNKDAGTVSNLRGMDIFTSNRGAGNVTNAYGVFAKGITNTGTGTVTNSYGIYTSASCNSGTGSITNAYGVFIEDLNCVSSSNFNLYSQGSNSKNYFAGLVGINQTTPQYKLDIDAQTGGSGNPLRLLGLNTGATSDSLLTSAAGVVRRLSFSQFVNSNTWSLTGNSGINSSTHFIGTTDNTPLSIRVNNIQSGYIGNSVTANTYLGYQTGVSASGANNTLIGYQAGSALTSGWSNTLIGYNANVASGTLANATAIGNGASSDASNKVRIGNSSVTVIEGQVNFSASSDRRLKKEIADNKLGLAFIKDLKPMTYKFISDKTEKVHDGFIAQDVEAALTRLGVQFSGLNAPTSDSTHYSLSYPTFVVPLVNAVKELDAENQKLKSEIEQLKNQIKQQKAPTTEGGQTTTGTMRFNTKNNRMEYFNGTTWVILSSF